MATTAGDATSALAILHQLLSAAGDDSDLAARAVAVAARRLPASATPADQEAFLSLAAEAVQPYFGPASATVVGAILAISEPARSSSARTPSTGPLPILSDVQINALPDPAWLVDNLLPERAVGVLAGQEGTAKTFMGLDVALCVGTGEAFHGRQVRQGPVAYVFAEGAPGLKHRVQAWKREHGLSESEPCNVWFITTGVDLAARKGAGLQALIDTIESAVPPPVRLVVIDTLARCFGAEDENSTQAMNTFTNRLYAIRDAFDCSVLVMHHFGWGENRERGSRSLRNNVETVMLCSKSRTRDKRAGGA